MAVAISLARGQPGNIHGHGRSLSVVAQVAACACPDGVALAARLAHDYMGMEISVLVGRRDCCVQARRRKMNKAANAVVRLAVRRKIQVC